MLLRGFSPVQMRELVAAALEPVLRPLVYDEPLRLLERHRERGEPSYIVSAALQEVVEAMADDLGFDGALGTVCEVEDGVYTGRSLRSLHGENKAAAVRELARERGYDLAESTAYSDSHTDLPFLEVVGNPVAVNPDRELRRVAAAARLAGAQVRRTCSLRKPARGSRRSASPTPTWRRSSATSTTPNGAASSVTATRGSPGSRRCPTSTPTRSPRACSPRTASSAGKAEARSAT